MAGCRLGGRRLYLLSWTSRPRGGGGRGEGGDKAVTLQRVLSGSLGLFKKKKKVSTGAISHEHKHTDGCSQLAKIIVISL